MPGSRSRFCRFECDLAAEYFYSSHQARELQRLARTVCIGARAQRNATRTNGGTPTLFSGNDGLAKLLWLGFECNKEFKGVPQLCTEKTANVFFYIFIGPDQWNGSGCALKTANLSCHFAIRLGIGQQRALTFTVTLE